MFETADTRFAPGQLGHPNFYPNFPYSQQGPNQQYPPPDIATPALHNHLMNSLCTMPPWNYYNEQGLVPNQPYPMYDQRHASWFGHQYMPTSPPCPMEDQSNFENTDSTPSPSSSNVVGLSASGSGCETSPPNNYYSRFPKVEVPDYHDACSPPNSVGSPLVQMGPITPNVKLEGPPLQNMQLSYDWMKSRSGTAIMPDGDTEPPLNPGQQEGSNELIRGQKSGKTRTKDKYRVVYSDTQRLELEKEFQFGRYITIKRKSELAVALDLSERQVKIWFQNRRAKDRKQKGKQERVPYENNQIYPDIRAQLAAQQMHATQFAYIQQQQQQQQHHQQQQQQQQILQDSRPGRT